MDGFLKYHIRYSIPPRFLKSPQRVAQAVVENCIVRIHVLSSLLIDSLKVIDIRK